MRILYIHANWVPPPVEPQRNRFSLLSAGLEGEVLQPVWFRKPEEVEQMYGPGSYPEYQGSRFRYHWFLAWRHKGLHRKMAGAWFYISKGLEIHRKRGFDCVITYGHMTTGLCGVVLKALTGAKLIVEIVTAPERLYLTERAKPTMRERLMRLYSDICLHVSLWSCDVAHLLAPGLIVSYRRLGKVRAAVFPEFVPVSVVPRHSDMDEPYIVFVGAPWYLKGADRLVEAFLRLASEFPRARLKIIGYCPDREQLEALTGGSPQIQILNARPNPEALYIISRAAVLALPSRCEGTPCVILEAMAAGVPVVGSDVGGIPHLIREGENGFVVPAGDSLALEGRLRQLLADDELRKRMGARGYELAHTEFSEKAYVDNFTRMVEAAVRGNISGTETPAAADQKD